jgi:hypothetical protein
MESFEGSYLEYSPEVESFEFEESEWAGEDISEAELMELAGELLQVDSEAELDQFLGKLIKRVGRGIGKIVRSPVGRAIGGFLKGAAKKALPLAGAALGGYFGGPLGAKIGSGLATAAGGALGLEAEMLSAEDREFESTLAAPPGVSPASAAQQAVKAAAAKFAPGLLAGRSHLSPPIPAGASGRWVRKGRNVVLLNC